MKNKILLILTTTSLTLAGCGVNENDSRQKTKAVSDVITTQESTRSKSEVASMEQKNNLETTARNSTLSSGTTNTQVNSHNTLLSGTYKGDNGKIYKFNSDGTLEIDSEKFKLSKPNESRKESTGEKFTNYNVSQGDSAHSSMYVEAYSDRIEIVYAGPVKSTKLTKTTSGETAVTSSKVASTNRIIKYKDVVNNATNGLKIPEKDIVGRTFFIDGDTNEDLRPSTMESVADGPIIAGYSSPRMFMNKNAGYIVYSYSKK